MKGIGRRLADFVVLGAAAGIVVLAAGAASAQERVPPVFVPFQQGNPFDPTSRGFDDSIRGFFDFERAFLSVVRNAPELQREFDTFEDEARAAVDQVPVPSGSMSVTYEFDPTLDTYVRAERPLAPALSLNAQTDGRGVITMGFAYSHLDYKTFKGSDRDQVVLVGELSRFDGSPAVDGQGRPLVDVSLFQFKLRQSIFSFSAQAGLTDWLDVGILIPVFDESFKARAVERFFVRNPDGSLQPALATADFSQIADDPDAPPAPSRDAVNLQNFTVPAGQQPLLGFSTDNDEFGIGDLVLRSKVFLGTASDVDFGALLNLSVPTGDEDNLLGVGSVRFDPRLLVSKVTNRFAGHVNAGYHADVDDGDRNRFDYAIGGEVLLTPWATLLLDQIGRMEVSGSDQIQKFDIVPGLKVNPYGNVVVGFNAIVPLNDDGLRTDFTPNATAEISTAF